MQGTISRRLWAKAGAERIPLTGAFELLPICNFACKMCYVRKSRAEVEKAGGLMDGKRWLEIAEDAAKCGLLFPLLTGGEPFLYEDFQEVFAGMQDLGMQVSINSNAPGSIRIWPGGLAGTHRPGSTSHFTGRVKRLIRSSAETANPF